MEALSATPNQISTQPNLLQLGGESRGRFRLMLVHDGYQHIDDAIGALRSRGLPADTEVLLLTVGDLFRASLHLVGKDIVPAGHGAATRSHSRGPHKKTQIIFHKLQSLQLHAHAKLQAAFPGWRISVEQPFGWQPNLIYLAACNQPSDRNPGLGEIIRKLSTESSIPFVVGRAPLQKQSSCRPALIAFDGPASGAAVLDTLPRYPAIRHIKFHLMFYKDPLMTHAERWGAGYEEPDREWIDRQLVRTKRAIEALGHEVTCVTVVGNTAETILAESKRIDAENILIGTGPLAALGPLSAQSIVFTVAARADCAVEAAFSGQHPRPAAKLQAIATPEIVATWQGRSGSRVGMCSSM